MAATSPYEGLRGRLALWGRLLHDMARSAPNEHLRGGGKKLPGGSGWRPGGLPADFRHGARKLLSRPGFTSVIVLTLAVGLGPTTAVYSLANWLLMRPLPDVADQDDLGFVW